MAGSMGWRPSPTWFSRKPLGLCDAVFRATPFIDADEMVAVGLPDTVWFPEDGLASLPDDRLSFLLFPVANPSLFDAVVTEPDGRITEIQVKTEGARSRWIWGAFKMPGRVFHELHQLWLSRDRSDLFMGSLVNAYLAKGGGGGRRPGGTLLCGRRHARRLSRGDPAPEYRTGGGSRTGRRALNG